MSRMPGGPRRRRALQPALPRSHDRRCPSGSGWGEAPAARTFGCRRSSRSSAGGVVLQRWRHPPPHGRPLTRESSVGVAWKADGPGVLLAGRRVPRSGSQGPPSQGSSVGRPARVALKGQGSRKGARAGSRCGGATRTAWRRATSAAPAGDREVGGCARGLFWLQKSTSGAGSRPSGLGLAPTPYAREGNLPARSASAGAFALRKGAKRCRGLLAAAMSRGPWRVAACMRRRCRGYGRQQCRSEGQGSP